MKNRHTAKNKTSVLTVRVPLKLRNRLEGLAESKATNRSRLALAALERYVDEEELQLAKVDQGVRDADAGRVVPHEDVKRYLQSWGSKRKLALPTCK
jgi:predicted transcriptional regulator